jgi:hypothetical protein
VGSQQNSFLLETNKNISITYPSQETHWSQVLFFAFTPTNAIYTGALDCG